MESKPDKCAHPICSCTAQTDSKFCSAYCEGVGEIADIVCNCGHGDCSHGHAHAPVLG